MSRAVGIDLGAEALRGVCIENLKGRLQLISAGTLPLGELGNLEDSDDKRLAIGEKLKDLVRGANLKAPLRRMAVSGKYTELRYMMVPPVPPWRLEMLVKYEIDERSTDKTAKTFDYRILDLPEVGGQYTVLVGAAQEATANWLLDIGKQSRLGEVELDLEPVALFNAYYHGHGFDPDKTVLIVDVGAEEVTALVVRNGSLYYARTFLGGGRRFSQAMADDLKVDALEADEIKKREGEIAFDLMPQPGQSRIQRTGRTLMLGASAKRITAGPGELPNLKGETAANGSPSAPPQPEPIADAPAAPTGALKNDLEISPSGEPQAAAPAAPDALRPGETAAERRKRQISAALVREAASLCAALENAVANCRQQTKLRELKIDKVYITGAGARVKGLGEFVSRRLRAPVEPLDIFRNIGMDRLPAEAAAALRKEQDLLAVSTGMALAGLCKGAFSFLLWPAQLKEKKEYWARGAYLYYAAAVLLGALLFFWLTPKHNVDVLKANKDRADTAISGAKVQNNELDGLKDKYEELYERMQQIEKNANSGNFFLGLLEELKDTHRIPPNIYLTSISTNLPSFIRSEFEEQPGDQPKGPAVKEPGAKPVAKTPGGGKAVDAPDTFQAQARVYLRGFARSGQKEDMLLLIKSVTDTAATKPGFADLLVPNPDSPDAPENLFKDIRPIWTDGKDHQQGPYYLKEFVLEAFVEGTREKKEGGAPKPPAPKPPAEGQFKTEALPAEKSDAPPAAKSGAAPEAKSNAAPPPVADPKPKEAAKL
ncbi:MAG: pilus assembly protein PilM [Planctomycetes bacterium]|nr:pilus assembly protein PilM [Planctomycetota bacterium]